MGPLSIALYVYFACANCLNARCALADPLTELFHLARAFFGYVSQSISGLAHEKQAHEKQA